jgi:predicted dienelactone hydrolase
MRGPRLLNRSCLALLGLPLVWTSISAQKHASGPLPEAKAGLVTRDITPAARRNWRGSPDHTFHVTIWYPAGDTAHELPQFIGPPDRPLFEAGSAAPHAPFAPSLEPFPLILLSHGSGGSAQQLAWLGTALARAGFIAAGVDHPGNTSGAPSTAEGFVLPWERATDLSNVLDGLLADPELAPHIDKDRIGAAGFSIGGYTVLELAGVRTDVSVITDLCRKEPESPACKTPEMNGMGTVPQMLDSVRKTSGESLARSADSFRDPRVRAVFAIAPALGFAQTPESLHATRVPVELVVGSADPLAPAATNASFIKAHVRGARETILPNVAHYTFLDTCTANGKAVVSAYCVDPSGVDRDTTHAQASDLAIQFFAKVFRLR